MKCYTSLNIKVISQYQFVCTRLSSAHTPTRQLVGVWALDKLVHTNRYYRNKYREGGDCLDIEDRGWVV